MGFLTFSDFLKLKDAELDPVDFHVFGEAIRTYECITMLINKLNACLVVSK